MTVTLDPLGWLDKFNPFGVVGDAVGKAAADGWTGIMLSLWAAGLWVLRFALDIMDRFLTPDISAGGPAADVYRTTFWGAGALVLIMALVQLGVSAFQRDGKSLARVLIGGAQFTMVWAAWITYGVAVLAACGGLTRALMNGLLNINAWSEWKPMPNDDFGKDGIEVALATILGILSLFLWIAALVPRGRAHPSFERVGVGPRHQTHDGHCPRGDGQRRGRRGYSVPRRDADLGVSGCASRTVQAAGVRGPRHQFRGVHASWNGIGGRDARSP